MTDPPDLPPDASDERDLLVAAYVDGEATPDERARVEADPALIARAEQFRRTKRLVADVPPPTADQRRAMLAAALAEHTAARPEAAPPLAAERPSHADVPSITPPPPARNRPRWLALAAAAVVFFAAGALVATQLGGGDDDDSADQARLTAPGGDGDAPRSAVGDEEGPDDEQDVAGAPATTQGGEDTTTERTAAGAEPSASDTTDLAADRSESAAGDPGRARTPPDDGGELVELERPSDVLDWYERVQSQTLRPPGAGTEVCDQTIAGWAAYGGPDRYVVVIRTPSDTLEARDPVSCATVLLAPLS